MKKGCFISLITFITIAIMVGQYLYKTNKDWFKEFGKDKISSMVANDIKDKIDKLDNNRYKDSLRILLKKEIKIVQTAKFENAMNELGYVMDKIKHYSTDGSIDSTEFAQLKVLVMENERSKKN